MNRGDDRAVRVVLCWRLGLGGLGSCFITAACAGALVLTELEMGA